VKPKQDHQPILDAQLSQVEVTFQEGSAIDAKALAIFAINVALLIFMAQGRLYFSEWWQTACLYGPFFISLIFDAIAFWSSNYFGPGLTRKQLPKYLTMTEDQQQLQFISTLTLAIEKNVALNYKRWRFFLLSMVFTVIGSGAILLYYI
jgi:hypothetical protein